MWSVIVGSFLFSVCASESLFADAAFARVKRQHPGQAQHQQQAPVQSFNYRPYQEAPDRIKQLLQLQQAREPLVHLPAAAPPQLQQLQATGQHRAGPAPQGPQHSPAAQPAQYSPNVQYGQAPSSRHTGALIQDSSLGRNPNIGPRSFLPRTPTRLSTSLSTTDPNSSLTPTPSIGPQLRHRVNTRLSNLRPDHFRRTCHRTFRKSLNRNGHIKVKSIKIFNNETPPIPKCPS